MVQIAPGTPGVSIAMVCVVPLVIVAQPTRTSANARTIIFRIIPPQPNLHPSATGSRWQGSILDLLRRIQRGVSSGDSRDKHRLGKHPEAKLLYRALMGAATPPGLSDEKAVRMMTALREGRTLRSFGVKAPRLEAYFKTHPEYAQEALPLIRANATAARLRKGSRLRRMTRQLQRHRQREPLHRRRRHAQSAVLTRSAMSFRFKGCIKLLSAAFAIAATGPPRPNRVGAPTRLWPQRQPCRHSPCS
jgi:hypothetical protein